MKQAVLILAHAGSAIEWVAALERTQSSVTRVSSEREAMESAARHGVILVRQEGEPAKMSALLQRIIQGARLPVILIQSRESPDLASVARACGVHDYLREPLPVGELVAAIESCVEAYRVPGKGSQFPLAGGERLVGSSAPMNDVRRQIGRIAATDCNVLITGETGTGKELVAELIHRNGPRRDRPFVCINCAAIPETLLESELFGYEKGAFTGAQTAKPGQLELAHGGALFLDEIGEMSLSSQAKILRVIEGKEVQRLGRRMGITVDVRILCATNRDLEAEVKRGTFRADLFFRLKVARLHLPPLCERKEDLPELAAYYFHELNARMGLQVGSFTDHSWRSLMQHDWPGNVREFKNVIESTLVQIPFPRMRVVELPEELHRQYDGEAGEPDESAKLLTALVTHNWNKSKAAAEMHWSRMTLYRKMAKYQLGSRARVQARTA